MVLECAAPQPVECTGISHTNFHLGFLLQGVTWRKTDSKVTQCMYDLITQNANIIDGSGEPAYIGDIIVDGGRIEAITDPGTQKARGYDYTIVNGEIFVENGNFTGKLAGQLVRAA